MADYARRYSFAGVAGNWQQPCVHLAFYRELFLPWGFEKVEQVDKLRVES
jgi:hypothetical protein